MQKKKQKQLLLLILSFLSISNFSSFQAKKINNLSVDSLLQEIIAQHIVYKLPTALHNKPLKEKQIRQYWREYKQHLVQRRIYMTIVLIFFQLFYVILFLPSLFILWAIPLVFYDNLRIIPSFLSNSFNLDWIVKYFNFVGDNIDPTSAYVLPAIKAMFLIFSWNLAMWPIITHKQFKGSTQMIKIPGGFGHYIAEAAYKLSLDAILRYGVGNIMALLIWLPSRFQKLWLLLTCNGLQSWEEQEVDALEVAYLLQKAHMKPLQKKKIEAAFRKQRIDPVHAHKRLEWIRAMLALPTQQVFTLTLDTAYLVEELKNYGKENISSYATLNPLQKTLYNEVIRNKNKLTTADDLAAIKEEKCARYSYFVHPKAYTGKSYFANVTIANALQVNNQNNNGLIAIECDIEMLLQQDPKAKSPSEWVRKLTVAQPYGYKRPILLTLVGMEKLRHETALRQQLLSLLSQPQPSYYDHWLQEEVFLPDIVIVTARQSLQIDQDDQLFKVIAFPGFTKESKKRIFWKSILPMLMKKHNIQEELSAQARTELDQMVENDPYDGLKALFEAADAYIENVKIVEG